MKGGSPASLDARSGGGDGWRGARVKLIRVEKKKKRKSGTQRDLGTSASRLEIRLIGNVVEDLEEIEREEGEDFLRTGESISVDR